jgi:Tfp pilus assembly protein PilV
MVRVHTKGVTLIEVLIAIGTVSVILIAVGLSVTSYVEARKNLLTQTKSTYLIEEGYETLRAIRDTNWSTLSALTVDDTYYFSLSTTTLSIVTTPEIIDTDYRRSFVVRSVYRNGSRDIVASTTVGATVDSNSRQFDISVANPVGTSKFSAILTNIHAQ